MNVDKHTRLIGWTALALCIGLCVAVSSVYLTLVFRVGNGRPVAPLDDSYIFFQYARQIARGRPWQYNDGDPPSRGMTSLLYPWLLASFYRLGFYDEQLVWVAMGSGTLWLAGIVVAAGRVWDALAPSVARPVLWRTITRVAVLLTGIVQWAAFTGMETGLLTLLLLLALEALLRRQPARAALWLSLAGLTRPEGLIASGAAWLTYVVTTAIEQRPGQTSTPGSQANSWRRLRSILVRALPLALAVLVGLVPSVVNWAVTGAATSAGLESKAWFYNEPRIGSDIARSIAVSYARVFVRILNGWDRHELAGRLVAPGLTTLAILGWIALGMRRRWLALLGTASWFWLGTLSTAVLVTSTWHLGRYQAPFIPVAVLVAVAGIQILWEGASDTGGVGSKRPGLARLAAGALLIWLLGASLPSTYHTLDAFRRTLSTTVRQQLALADWVREQIPEGARVGVTDIGVLRYVGQRPTYDLVGLATAEATRAWRHGSGSIFEQMEHSPLRPVYFATYPDVMAAPYLAATDLFGQELYAVRVDDYVVTSAGPVQKVWRADWRLAGSGEQITQADVLASVEGLALVDTLDVADLEDEARHHLEWWHSTYYTGFPTEVHQQRHHAPPHVEVLDGGRLFSGGMAFQIDTQPGQPLWIVARLHPAQAGAVHVTIDGQAVGRWAFPSLPGAWLETLFRIPAEAITETETRIHLELEPGVPPAWLNPTQPWQHYAPYQYWFFQGEPQHTAPPIVHRLDVAFDDLRLLGFDLEDERLAPGQVLSTTLYWKTDVPTESTARVFLHLYSEQGDLGPQSDGWPVSGTRPPYTWQPGDTIVDRRAIPLPADLPPGRYALEVGWYDAGGRLTPRASAPSLHQQSWAEKRVLLGYVEVTER